LDLGLREKVALVTGASKGIGRAIAEEFAREGAHVSICARGKEDMARSAEGLRKHGVTVVTTLADVSKAGDVQRVIDETVKQLGRIDVLVNNAGDIWYGHSVDTTDAEWQYCMEVNLFSAVRFTRGVVPHMRRQGGGRIVNISSAAGHTPGGPFVDYNAAKAAMLAFSATMAGELASYNILVNSVCPALIRTPLYERFADSMIPALGKSREEVFQNIASRYLPIKRFGREEEVSALVVFIASSRATFMTGSAYDVDGGFPKSI